MPGNETELEDLIQRLRVRGDKLLAEAKVDLDKGDTDKTFAYAPAVVALSIVVEELEITLGRYRHG